MGRGYGAGRGQGDAADGFCSSPRRGHAAAANAEGGGAQRQGIAISFASVTRRDRDRALGDVAEAGGRGGQGVVAGRGAAAEAVVAAGETRQIRRDHLARTGIG